MIYSFPHKASAIIKEKAKLSGFDFCGIAKAEFLEEEAPRLENWLKKSRHGNMSWMENYFDKRLDPRLLADGAKSVVTVLLNYYPEKEIKSELKISKYAYGQDYHDVIRNKLNALIAELKSELGEFNARAFVDSAPVMDKVWAKKGGLGWIGKNSNLLNRNMGSFFFIAEIITDLELEYDGPVQDFCGTCTRCMDACPTDAITEAYVVDGSKCISYLTIELKENIPAEFSGKMENWVFGCDICQDVCPWNRFSRPHSTPEFIPSAEIIEFSSADWQAMTEDAFGKVFKKSAVKRAKYQGLMKNIRFVKP